MDDPKASINNEAGNLNRTDHDMLVRLEVHMQNARSEIKSLGETVGTRITNLHDRLIPLERFKDQCYNEKIFEKAEEAYQNVRDFKLTYKISTAIFGTAGMIIGFLMDRIILPIFIKK